MRITPQQAMAMAIEEGKKGTGFVSPNPLVGCVILDRDGRLLAKGYHARLGEAHAEVHALKQVNDPTRLVGAQVFVTLEPCAHEGRTGSCAKLLATLPIASVTYGLEDPNPLVSGQGASILRAAGKTVERSESMQDELEELAEIFLLNMRVGRPFIALKVAASLDGQVALADGSSQWITGGAAREHVQFLRGSYDAVLTGIGTVEKDNPRLNSRDSRFLQKPQSLVVLDPEGSLNLKTSRLLEVRKPEAVFWVTSERVRSSSSNMRHLRIPMNGDRFDLSVLVSELKKENIFSLFVEAGPFTSSAFLSAAMVDRLYLFTAPKILGTGLSWTSGLKVPDLERALKLKALRVQTLGEDLLTTGRLLWS